MTGNNRDPVTALLDGDLKMWYREPTDEWNEGLPIGSGHVGAMVLGGPARARIALNHTRLWRELPFRGRTNPRVAHNLPGIRKLFFEGRIVEASRAANALLGVQTGLEDN